MEPEWEGAKGGRVWAVGKTQMEGSKRDRRCAKCTMRIWTLFIANNAWTIVNNLP